MQSIVRVEEVEKKGQSAIRDAESGERVVTPFPLPAKPRQRRRLGWLHQPSDFRLKLGWWSQPSLRPATTAWPAVRGHARLHFGNGTSSGAAGTTGFLSSANAAAIGASPSSTSPALLPAISSSPRRWPGSSASA